MNIWQDKTLEYRQGGLQGFVGQFQLHYTKNSSFKQCSCAPTKATFEGRMRLSETTLTVEAACILPQNNHSNTRKDSIKH
jgi:hypothetical protein